jgi:hypothetical protein
MRGRHLVIVEERFEIRERRIGAANQIEELVNSGSLNTAGAA